MQLRLFTPQVADIAATKVNEYIRWLTVPILIGLGFLALFSIKTGFKRVYSLEDFIAQQAKVWPVITPIVKFNPGKHTARPLGSAVPKKLPIFAEALSPEEWLAYQQINVVNGVADREQTRKVFAQQLGPRWAGPEKLPLYARALFAAFALQGVQKRDESNKLLGDIAQCWTAEKGLQLTAELEKFVNEVVAEADLGGKGKEIAAKFAYRHTALAGLLKWARTMGGVLASAQFLWLRAEDRVLWYVLNNLGRRSYHAEGAGAMAHFMAEQNAKKPLTMPRVETAYVTLNQVLSKSGVPIPPLVDK
jgi:intracellular multiplication protein IcmP